MTRRTALLVALSVPLGSFVKLAVAQPGHLRIPLDQWAGITFEHAGQKVTLTGAEVFRIIKGDGK